MCIYFYLSPYLLEPTDPLFKQIGQQFLKTVSKIKNHKQKCLYSFMRLYSPVHRRIWD